MMIMLILPVFILRHLFKFKYTTASTKEEVQENELILVNGAIDVYTWLCIKNIPEERKMIVKKLNYGNGLFTSNSLIDYNDLRKFKILNS